MGSHLQVAFQSWTDHFFAMWVEMGSCLPCGYFLNLTFHIVVKIQFTKAESLRNLMWDNMGSSYFGALEKCKAHIRPGQEGSIVNRALKMSCPTLPSSLPTVYSTLAHRNVNPTSEPTANVFLSCLTCFSQTGHDMYGLNENNSLTAQCQTIFCQEHHGDWKIFELLWPTGQVLRGSGFDVFHKKPLKSGASSNLSWDVCSPAAVESC